jgi:hypothetical protein
MYEAASIENGNITAINNPDKNSIVFPLCSYLRLNALF